MIKNRLHELLAETDTTQEQLARAIKRSKNTVNAFAREEPHKLLEMIDAICEYFGIPLEDLLYREVDYKAKTEEDKDFTKNDRSKNKEYRPLDD